MTGPAVVTTVAELRARVAAWRAVGARIGLVPTMGALHEGHLALVRETQSHAARVVVSIFVNPVQFGPHEDFDRYPRTLNGDCSKLAGTGAVDFVFAPCVTEMYPDGFGTKVEVGGPSAGLEANFRPHFFAGVATVVTKLLIAVTPDVAVFGEKDYQQLLLVRRLVRDLALPVEIQGAAIVREADGLAMSSRNAYLSAAERKIAGRLNCILKDAVARVRNGEAVVSVEAASTAALLDSGFARVDYVAVRDAATLAPVERFMGNARILAAATVGKTRLIDNMAV